MSPAEWVILVSSVITFAAFAFSLVMICVYVVDRIKGATL